MPCFPDIPLALFSYLKEASHSRQGNLQNLFIYKNIPSGNDQIPSMSDYFIFSFFHPWIVSVRSEHVHFFGMKSEPISQGNYCPYLFYVALPEVQGNRALVPRSTGAVYQGQCWGRKGHQ